MLNEEFLSQGLLSLYTKHRHIIQKHKNIRDSQSVTEFPKRSSSAVKIIRRNLFTTKDITLLDYPDNSPNKTNSSLLISVF